LGCAGRSDRLSLPQPVNSVAATATAAHQRIGQILPRRRSKDPAATLVRVSDRLCILTVHAHPDDEASKGAPTIHRYHLEGIHTVLVCCTGGEEGDVNNPALVAEGGPLHGLSDDDLRRELARRRPLELARATAEIGFDEVIMLGYRDSGMKDSPANANPQSFHMAPFDEAVARLVAHIRRTRPQVLITYGDDHSGYPHPDHVKVHEISVAAFERAGDPAWHPEAGPAWTPSKLYYTVWSRERIVAWHERFVALGLESPYDARWFERPSQDDKITTRLSLTEAEWSVRTRALLAHETQIDPSERFWFGLSEYDQWAVYPYEEWMLARSHVAWPEAMEDDLFAGLRPMAPLT
jgi:mycothiol S-conjugate amidase